MACQILLIVVNPYGYTEITVIDAFKASLPPNEISSPRLQSSFQRPPFAVGNQLGITTALQVTHLLHTRTFLALPATCDTCMNEFPAEVWAAPASKAELVRQKPAWTHLSLTIGFISNPASFKLLFYSYRTAWGHNSPHKGAIQCSLQLSTKFHYLLLYPSRILQSP
jgi:hypothetical protein